MTGRRDVIRTLAAVAAQALVAPRVLSALTPSTRAQLAHVGVQLYLLRGEMRRNPEATIARIATLGYTDVEWWGTWDRTPAQLRGLLDASGLKSTAAHVDPAELSPDRLPALLERAHTMGHRTLIVAWTPPAERTREGWMRLARRLTDAGGLGARVGIKTGYHNHDFEFTDLGGRTAWDILVGETDPAFVTLELDCFWAFKAGQNPVEMIERHAGRITHLHLKDSSGAPEHVQRDVGAGVIDWRMLLERAVARGVTHAYVEHDEPADAWATASAGRAYLRSIGY
jgi:sugar phosphate isomerase/epimerase